ncbi:hypothetical protein [Halorussus caseinilyticus]|uniref:Metallo-beta-lactamase domain-containing protein n=1 Tax=Halorussus caseinilyticus TaxID=3034025 RepID=A0ABD5WKU5_9EURY|nr:hypothetical protein [Halorussus sp. DT72]
MHLTLLGSGGDSQTPMPTCDCRVCDPAREEGAPHARLGNSTLVREANAVVDAPESIWAMLNRHDVTDVEYIFVSHHHMDHVGVCESCRPSDARSTPSKTGTTRTRRRW